MFNKGGFDIVAHHESHNSHQVFQEVHDLWSSIWDHLQKLPTFHLLVQLFLGSRCALISPSRPCVGGPIVALSLKTTSGRSRSKSFKGEGRGWTWGFSYFPAVFTEVLSQGDDLSWAVRPWPLTLLPKSKERKSLHDLSHRPFWEWLPLTNVEIKKQLKKYLREANKKLKPCFIDQLENDVE